MKLMEWNWNSSQMELVVFFYTIPFIELVNIVCVISMHIKLF